MSEEPIRPRWPPEPPTTRLAASEARAPEAPRSRARWLLVACLVFSLIALGLASYALVSAQEAKNDAHKSEHVAKEATSKADENAHEGEESKGDSEEGMEEAGGAKQEAEEAKEKAEERH